MYFEDAENGEQFTTLARTITEGDIADFARVSGDFSPLHTNQAYAEKTRFRGRIAHGLLSLAVASGLCSRLDIFGGSGFVAFYGIDNLRFTKPVMVGDTIAAKLTVTEKSDRGELGLITFRNEVVNQKNETVLVCDLLLLFNRRKLRSK